MKINENEMRGLLSGRCIPGDMKVNESLPAYLVRKFDEQQKKLDALAAEFWLTRHLIPDEVVTPSMEYAISEIKAEGVEILTGKLQQLIEEGAFDAKEIGVAAGAVYEGAQIAAQLRAGEDK